MTHENFCYWLKGYTSNPNKNWQEVEKQLKVLFPDYSVNYTGSLKLGSITGNLTSDGNITYTSSTGNTLGLDTITMLNNADYGRYVLAYQ